MADVTDRADDVIERQRELAIQYRKPTGGLLPTGYCHSCGGEVGTSKLFCDGVCADDFDRAEELRGRR